MWEPQPLTTLRASKACRGENFTFNYVNSRAREFSSSASQEIPAFYGTWKFITLFTKKPPLHLIFTQINTPSLVKRSSQRTRPCPMLCVSWWFLSPTPPQTGAPSFVCCSRWLVFRKQYLLNRKYVLSLMPNYLESCKITQWKVFRFSVQLSLQTSFSGIDV
jgi:hypothetical protein